MKTEEKIRQMIDEWVSCGERQGRRPSDDAVLSGCGGEQIAFAHCLNHISNAPPDGKAAVDNWVRVTVCFEKIGNEWKVTHEHLSMPIDETGRGATNVKP